MKKIIATVLAMVMALALCTTAFAAPKTAFGDATNGIPTYNSQYSYELKAAVAAYDKNVGTFQVFKTDADTKAVTNEGMFVKVTKEQAEKILVVGNTITYLATSTTFGTAYADKGAAATTVDTLKNCDDVKAKDGVSTVTKVYCDTCKKSFDFVVGTATDAAAKFGIDNYKLITAAGYTNTDTKSVYIKLGSGSADNTTNTTKPSPKTFDAGIAMYVGMALTSVAGSAVVIGKKKEF